MISGFLKQRIDECGMKLAGNDRNVDSIGDCINKYG